MAQKASGRLLELFHQWESGFNTPAWMKAGDLINGVWLQYTAINRVTNSYPFPEHMQFEKDAKELIDELHKAQDAYRLLKTGDAGIRLSSSGDDFDIVELPSAVEGMGLIVPVLATVGVALIVGCIGWLAEKVVERDRLKNEGLRIVDDHMRWIASQPEGVQSKIKGTPEWIEAMSSLQKAGVPTFDIGPGAGLSLGMVALIVGGIILLQYLGKNN